MSLETLMIATQRFGASMDALVALGAELRLRREGLFAAPRVRQLLQEIVQHIDPKMFDDVTPDQEATALAIIEAFVRQAVEFLENPAAAPEWSYRDPVVLHGQGLTSRRFIRAIETLAAGKPGLKMALERPGALLDVGTGVGWLAIEAARSWSAWKVVGIDRWEPALSLARANVAASGFGERIELRAQNVEQLEDCGVFTLAWFPAAFLAKGIVQAALARIRRSMIPGGWVVIGIPPTSSEPWGEAVNVLKIVRNGGHPWKSEETEVLLHNLGFEQVEHYSPGPGTNLMIGRRPSL